jgi:hypothetical protein
MVEIAESKSQGDERGVTKNYSPRLLGQQRQRYSSLDQVVQQLTVVTQRLETVESHLGLQK